MDRVEREARAHDERYTNETRTAASKYYEAASSGSERYVQLIDAGLPAPVLEIGCGPNAAVLRPSLAGVERLAIDVSKVAVERAREAGTDARFEVMDAHELDLPDGWAGAVIGSGVLHHLDLDLAWPELARVLRPGGVGVFLEPLGHNPAINLYRRLTPKMRTPDEHPLLMADFEQARRHFASVDVEYFGLISPLAALPGVRRLGDRIRRADRWLIERPRLQRHAWMALVRLQR